MSKITERMKQAPGAMVHFVADRLVKPEINDPAEVSNGKGAIVPVAGKKVAVYRDEEGNVHALSPVCTHMKCIVGWNDSEKTWDCPCHGSRFDAYGKVIEGPARKRLEKVDLE